ncbi:MAG: fibronectin type III domain-containing protein [Bacteroides sp.]|nr:fibronectin type III domain-containing protein [Bacteroides sp.]MCM1084814.1 fibronectin type III domain-containing protein [Bacteroides sp.]
MKKMLFGFCMAAPRNGRRGLAEVRKAVLCILVGLLLLGVSALRAQTSDSASVYLTGKVCRNQVWLRWAVATPELWQNSLERGWVLERYDFDTLQMGRSARANLAYAPVRTQIDIPPFRQVDTAKIAALAETDMYAAVLGEAVYNPDIALSMGGLALSPWEQISREMERKQMRFALANVACDRSFAVACLGGMGYVDADVQKGHYYLYRLYAAGADMADSSAQAPDTALYFTRMESGTLLPPVQEIQVENGYLTAKLEWDIRFAARQSIGYYVERALEAKKPSLRKYVRLNQTPLSVLQGNGQHAMRYADSLPDAQNRYVYHVIGVDLFGQEFTVAQSRAVQSAGMPLAVAEIDSVTGDELGRCCLYWSYPEENMASVKGFSVYVASLPDWNESESSLLAAQLPPQTRRFTVSPGQMDVSSYFYVKTLGDNGQSTLSRAFFYWKKDSLPPLPPTELAYTVDTAGIVRISWKPSPDADVAGYRVFRQVEEKAEPVQVTAYTLADTSFIDTVSLNTLQSFYYSVRAVDVSGNISKPSALLAVRNLLPDKPAPAVFSGRSHVAGDKVELVWYNSQTSNARGHALYYRCDSSSWFLLKDFPADSKTGIPETFSFTFAMPERHYTTRYTFNIVAYGSDKGRDTVNCPFTYEVEHMPVLKPKTPFAIVDADNRYVQLQWKEKSGKPVARMYLYRRAENDKLRLLAALDAETAAQGFYTDFSVRMNTEYAYVIQYEYQDGLWSAYSAPCTVVY